MAKSKAEQFRALVARESEIKFVEADERVEVAELNKKCIVVKYGPNKMVFKTNANFAELGISSNLEQYAINDKVNLRPVYSGYGFFAYIGFEYDGVLYQLDGQRYDTAYEYICSHEFDPKYVPESLATAAKQLKDEIDNLPEIDFCKKATVEITNERDIVIHYGPNTIHAYLDDWDLMQIGFRQENFKYIKSQPIVGKYDGDHYLFLKIGKFTFKIDEIPRTALAEVYVHSHYKL